MHEVIEVSVDSGTTNMVTGSNDEESTTHETYGFLVNLNVDIMERQPFLAIESHLLC